MASVPIIQTPFNGKYNGSVYFGTRLTNSYFRRGPLAVQAIPLILLFPITFALPETPRWLVSKGKDEQALKVLGRLHEASLVQFEFDEIKRHLAAEK
jgi:hypothetical protein